MDQNDVLVKAASALRELEANWIKPRKMKMFATSA